MSKRNFKVAIENGHDDEPMCNTPRILSFDQTRTYRHSLKHGCRRKINVPPSLK